jgi:hypothetical protein
MCLSEKQSWIAFAIGTIFNLFNIFTFKNKTVTIISLLWQWVLFMQVFEAIAWKNQPSGETCNKDNKRATNGALIANLTQPIILALMMVVFTTSSEQQKFTAMGIIFIYICWMIYALNNIKKQTCLKPKTGCDHLNLSWWETVPGGTTFYMMAMVATILLLVRPMKFAMFELGYILIALAISMKFYRCGTGSMWCYLAAFAPAFTGLFWSISQ